MHITTLKQAEAITGSLGKPFKMPGMPMVYPPATPGLSRPYASNVGCPCLYSTDAGSERAGTYSRNAMLWMLCG
jgi:hypothetical protein